MQLYDLLDKLEETNKKTSELGAALANFAPAQVVKRRGNKNSSDGELRLVVYLSKSEPEKRFGFKSPEPGKHPGYVDEPKKTEEPLFKPEKEKTEEPIPVSKLYVIERHKGDKVSIVAKDFDQRKMERKFEALQSAMYPRPKLNKY